MKKNNHFRALLAIAMMLCVALPTLAHDFEVDGIYYKYLDQSAKTVEVTFRGGSHLADSSNVYVGSVSIPLSVTYSGTTYSVTSIGQYAFNECRGLTSITIPNSIGSIKMYAFYNCSNLTSVTMGDSVVSIGERAFMGCSSLTSIVFPNSLVTIGERAFSNCSGLTGSLIIPNSVTKIGDYTFFNCNGLTGSLIIPSSMTQIGNYTFYNCSGLTSVIIPNSVTSIGGNAFKGCAGLTSVTIGNSVTSIGDYVFDDCATLTSVTIPNSITSIGKSAFSGCVKLDAIIYNAINCTSTKEANLSCSKFAVINKDVINIPDNLNNSRTLGKNLISLPAMPPMCGEKSFTNETKTLTTLYVPKGSYATYWSAPVWQDFKDIKEIEQVVTEITLPKSINMTLNNTTKLETTIKPENATITELFWESSDPEVAKVDQDGNVTAVANGKATISAYTIDGSELSASCEVKIGIKEVESIIINQTSAELKPNEMLNLSCSILPEDATNRTYTWSSSNTAVAVVRTNSDGNATVLAVSPGITTITATTNDGTNLSDTCVVKVLRLAESITLDKTTASVNTDNIIDITATILPDDADYKNVTWSISDSTLATIKDNGNCSVSITAVNPGVVTVTATTVDGSNLSASCEITITKLAESIALDKEKISMVTGHEETLVATVLPDNTSNKSVTWTLSDTSLATLIDNGDGTASITAINPGVVNVIVTTTDGTELFASCEITIIQLATSISLDKETISIEEGKSEILTATVMPDNTSNKIVEWSSSDESIATVVDNNDGTAAITVHKKGVTTITATTTDGSNLSATCEVSGLSGILGIEVDCIREKRYDIHGRLLSKPSPGLNIIIKNDGTTRKEIIK